MFELPTVVVLGLILCGIALLIAGGFGLFLFLVQIGVIVRHAQRPPHTDTGDYRLDQGREVRAEDEERR